MIGKLTGLMKLSVVGAQLEENITQFQSIPSAQQPNGVEKQGCIGNTMYRNPEEPIYALNQIDTYQYSEIAIQYARVALEQLCNVPDRKRTISSDTFRQISASLHTYDAYYGRVHQSHAWSYRPRTYTLLHKLNQVETLMDRFARENLTDFHIPYTDETLPDFVQPQTLRQAFLYFQDYVLSEGHALETEPGHHHFRGAAEDHFNVVRKLGKGGFGYVRISQ
jgi:hypothetical protein